MKWRSIIVRALAWILRIDMAEATKAEEVPEAVILSEASERLSESEIQSLASARLAPITLGAMANERLPDDEFEELASARLSDGELYELARDRLPEEYVAGMATECLSDGYVEDLAREREAFPDPIEEVVRMPDDPRGCYAWVLDESATEDDRASLTAEFEEAFMAEHGREPQSLHLIVNDVEEIREFTSEEVRNFIKPWLKGTERAKREETGNDGNPNPGTEEANE